MVRIVILVLLPTIAIVFFLFQLYQRSIPKSKFLTYNDSNGKWEYASEKIIIQAVASTEQNIDGFHNKSILRGFFDRYDSKTNILYIKAVMPFINKQLYQLIAVKIGLQQTFYCIPSTIANKETGESNQTWSYRFKVYDGETLNTYYEKSFSLEDFFSRAKNDTWLFLQLNDNYSEKKDNYLYKLVAVGICE